jgi:peptide/nickel transport system ATP-binding protein
VGIVSQVRGLEQSSQASGRRPILEAKDIAVTFSKTSGFINRKKSIIKAVDHVSFEIFESEIISLVGESGSGKTTIARAILGLAKLDSGSIKFEEKDVSRLRGKALKEYRKDVQLIFQDPFESLSPRMDVFSIVSTPMKRLSRESKTASELVDKVSSLLSETGLDPGEVLHKYPHELSGGQRQRLNIARALASNPRLLIADEPITMLDASQRVNILSLLMQLKMKRNLTILLITHDLASAKIMSDRTLVMYLGKLVEEGPTRQVLSRPHHPYSELILSATPRLSERIDSFKGSALVTLDESGELTRGCIFRPRCGYATEVCADIDPDLKEKSMKHYAACHNPLNMDAEN